MRLTALVTAAALTLAACAGAPGGAPDLARIAGPGNAAALEAAARCNNDAALDLARGAAEGASPDRQLFSQFIQAAVLTEQGREAEAAQAIQVATDDPGMNPEGRPVSAMTEGATALLGSIRQQRAALTGSPTC